MSVNDYLKNLALLEKELKEVGPSYSLYARADALMRVSPIDNYVSPDKYLGR